MEKSILNTIISDAATMRIQEQQTVIQQKYERGKELETPAGTKKG